MGEKNIWSILNIGNLLVLASFLYMSFGLSRNTLLRLKLFAILSICLLHELVSGYMKIEGKEMAWVYTVNILIHQLLWISVLFEVFSLAGQLYTIIILFGFAIVNMIAGEGFLAFNYYPFIVSSFIYLLIFIYKSLDYLKKERFTELLSNNYLLVCAPILFFISMDAVFGFKSHSLAVSSFYGIQLYTILNGLANISYHGIVIIFIYMERRERHG